MTKEQKARAHLARAQELLGQGSSPYNTRVTSNEAPGFGTNGTGDVIEPSPTAESTAHKGGEYEEHNYKYLLHLTSFPDDVITSMITAGEFDGAQLSMLMQVGNRNLKRLIKEILAMKFDGYNDDDILKIKDLHMVRLLVMHSNKKANPGLFLEAITEDRRDIVTALLDAGEDVNQTLDEALDYYWAGTTTPLSLAIGLGKYDIVKILIDKDADFNKKVRYIYQNSSVYLTPLDLAFKRYLSKRSEVTGDELEIVRYLLKKGADPHTMVYLSKNNDHTEFTASYKYMQRDLDPSNQKDLQLLSLLQRARLGT